jgi:hypothetical protein
MSVRQHSRTGAISKPAAIAFAILLSAPFCQAQEKLSFKIDDEVTRFAFSTDGRVAYAVRHVFSEKKIELQRDDVWIAERDGKKRRILQGEKFVRGSGPFSYLVRGLSWSPDGTKLTVELATSEMINENGDTREGVITLLLDDSGKEIQIAGGDSVIPGAVNAAWLADGVNIVYLTAVQPETPRPLSEKTPNKEKLFTVSRVQVSGGAATTMFLGEKFTASEWNTTKGTGLAIRHALDTIGTVTLSVPVHLIALDLVRQTSRDLATLDGYAGGLSISPSGDKAAYWVSNEQLEVREIGSPNRVARVRVILGTLAWARDEKRVLVKQGPAAKSGNIVWAALPPLSPVAAGAKVPTQDVPLQPILHGLEFRQFDISPDGSEVGVVEPGRRNLLVYALP